MTRHYNTSIVERALRQLNSKQGDYLPDEVSGPVAVIVLEPVCRVVKSAGTGTIFATPADKDFYLSGATLAFAKASTDTGTLAVVTVVVDGVSSAVLRLPGITLTAERDSLAADFSIPIKCDRGTSVTLTLTGTFTIAAATIRGFTEEVTKT